MRVRNDVNNVLPQDLYNSGYYAKLRMQPIQKLTRSTHACKLTFQFSLIVLPNAAKCIDKKYVYPF